MKTFSSIVKIYLFTLFLPLIRLVGISKAKADQKARFDQEVERIGAEDVGSFSAVDYGEIMGSDLDVTIDHVEALLDLVFSGGVAFSLVVAFLICRYTFARNFFNQQSFLSFLSFASLPAVAFMLVSIFSSPVSIVTYFITSISDGGESSLLVAELVQWGFRLVIITLGVLLYLPILFLERRSVKVME